MRVIEWPMVGRFVDSKDIPGSGGGGGGGGGGGTKSTKKSSSSSSSSAAETWRLECKSIYNTLTQQSNANPPAEVMAAFVASKGHFTAAQMATLLRTSKKGSLQKDYLKTIEAQNRMADFRKHIHSIMGDAYNSAKDMPGLIAAYALSPSTVDFDKYFNKVVTKSPAFATMFPYFKGWYEKQVGGKYTSAAAAVKGYVDAAGAYLALWHGAGLSGDVPPGLLQEALTGNYDDATFKNKVLASPVYNQSPTNLARVTLFKQQWDTAFANTDLEGQYDPALINEWQMHPDFTFDDLVGQHPDLEKQIEDTHVGYADWRKAQQSAGTDPSRINIGTYLQGQAGSRSAFSLWYKDILGADAVIPSDLLAKAMAGNWDQTIFNNYVKQNDPTYKTTPSYQKDVQSFTTYWHGLFGPNSSPDASLASLYVSGNYSDPSQLFDQVRNTAEFQSQYGNWDAYAAGQRALGNNASNDPLQYQAYVNQFNKSFSDQGIQVPQEFLGKFLSSGLTDTEFKSNIAQYAQQKNAYAWQSGQQADLATTAGLANPTAGGDIRNKLAEALKQHQTYLQSNFKSYQTNTNQADQIVQKV